MIKSKGPQPGDVVIIRAADGFWTHRVLDAGGHAPARVHTLEAAVASGGAIAIGEHVSLWLTDDHLRFQMLANCRQQGSKPDRVVHCVRPGMSGW